MMFGFGCRQPTSFVLIYGFLMEVADVVRNVVKAFRFTTKEWLSLENNAKAKNLPVREYILELNNNSSGFVDKKGLKILLYGLLEKKVAKKLCDKHGIK